MKRVCATVVLFALLCVSALQAVGTVTQAVRAGHGGVTRYTLSWTSSAGGAVSGNTGVINVRPGRLVQVKFIPGSGGTQPTDQYDVTLVDADAVDVLYGAGANLSNAAATMPRLDPLVYLDGTAADPPLLDLVVANAGAAKTGTVILWVN